MREIKFRGKRVDNGEWVLVLCTRRFRNTGQRFNNMGLIRRYNRDLERWKLSK